MNQDVQGGGSLWGHSLLPSGLSKICVNMHSFFFKWFFKANNGISCLRIPIFNLSLLYQKSSDVHTT